MNPSRILFIHSGSDLYGASRSLLRLSSRLVGDGAVVKAVLPQNGPLVLELRKIGVDVDVQKSLPVIERQKLRNLMGLVQLSAKFVLSIIYLLWLIKQFKPDIVHTMSSVILSSGPVAKLAGVSHIWHVREFFGEFGVMWRYYQKYILQFSTRIICVSTAVAEQFEHFKHNSIIHVIHNGFPVDEFLDITPNRVKEFRSKYATSGVNYIVGVVGRIKFQRKGQEIFVRAASLLHDKFPDARFLCIGSPYPGNEAHLANLLSLIKELHLEGYVIYTGDVDDIKAAIKALDILVLSSVQPEPFGGVVVEAMALGRPVVATATGGSLEQVADGVTGYLVEPGNPESMAEAIGKLLEAPDQARQFGQSGRRRFLDQFEFEPFYKTMLSLYEKVIGQ